jgi:hypothetical protein
MTPAPSSPAAAVIRRWHRSGLLAHAEIGEDRITATGIEGWRVVLDIHHGRGSPAYRADCCDRGGSRIGLGISRVGWGSAILSAILDRSGRPQHEALRLLAGEVADAECRLLRRSSAA